jgi:hypothetical protein
MPFLEEKVIELSKIKLLFAILGSLLFVALGLWMVSIDSATIESLRRYNYPLIVRGLGIVGILFFGFTGIMTLKKIFDKKPGLILNSMGIIDNSSSISDNILIPWSEISGLNIYEVTKKQKFLVFLLKNPDKYIEAGNSLIHTLKRVNYEKSGSPLAISSNSLKISFNKLVEISNEYFAKYGNNT